MNAHADIAGSSTASGSEIARFDRIAADWWNPHGKFRPLHELNPVRVGYIRHAVTRHFCRDNDVELPLDGLAVIDIGCGGGLVAEAVARLGAHVVGVDASAQSIAVAERHAQAGDLAIEYRCAAAEDLAGEGRRFDVVLALEVLEHVADLGAFVEVAGVLLRPGGVMLLSTLNRTLKSLLLAKVGAEYVLRWLPVGTHDWRKFIRPSELAFSLRRSGLQLTDLSGLVYDPLRGSWSSGRDLAVNYMAAAVRA